MVTFLGIRSRQEPCQLHHEEEKEEEELCALFR